MIERCHTSWYYIPAPATLKSRRSRSFKLRTICRLSFSECASGMCSSRVSRPTGMSGSAGQGLQLFARSWRAALRCGFRRAQLRHLEAFQYIADFHIVEIRDSCSTFKAGAHLASIVLEALERAQLRGVNDRSVAHDPHLRVPLEYAVHYVAARHRARALDAERVAHFRAAHVRLLDHRL